MEIPAPNWSPMNSQYHATKGRWSNSRLNLFRESPYRAFVRYVADAAAEPGAKPVSSSPAMDLGSAFGAMVSGEPDKLYVAECKTRAAKAFKQAEAAFPDRVVLTEKERDDLLGMWSSLSQPATPGAQVANALLIESAGFFEYAIRFDLCEVPCMAKLDKFVMMEGKPAIVELKTTFDPRPNVFTWHAYRRGYYRQAAFYREAARSVVGGKEDVPVFFVVARNSWPYEIFFYQVTDEYLNKGKHDVKETLKSLKLCLVGEKPWRDRGETTVNWLAAPGEGTVLEEESETEEGGWGDE